MRWVRHAAAMQADAKVQKFSVEKFKERDNLGNISIEGL